MEEIWKKISGYDYEVSNLGNVRTIYFHNNKVKKEQKKVLKQQTDRYGRKRVMLYRNGKPKLFQIHFLVAQAFLNKNNYKCQPYEINVDKEKLEINHKDENPLNNIADNLEWCTHDYNMHYGNIKEKQIAKIKLKKVKQYDLDNKFVKLWNSVSDITKELGVSKQCISYCCAKKTKTAGGFIWRYADE